MLKMSALLVRFRQDGGGATAIEYAMIASLISVAIIGGLASTQNGVGVRFNQVMESVSAALNRE